MEPKSAVSALAALAHVQRLKIFRLLVRQGPNGLTAGRIAQKTGASATATSFHLKELLYAGLLHRTREGRYIRYAIHVDGMRRLLAYLTEDCCQGQPHLCGDTFAKAATRQNSI